MNARVPISSRYSPFLLQSFSLCCQWEMTVQIVVVGVDGEVIVELVDVVAGGGHHTS
jgi:hypothetical protein